MSQTANRSPESARRKFVMNSTYIMSRKQDQTFLGSGGQVEPNSQQLARNGEKKIFHELDVHHVQKVGIKRFQGSGGRNESNSHHQLALMGEKKFFIISTYIGCFIHLDLMTPKTFDSYFLDMMYVGFMKNFLLADSCELLAVRLSLSS